MDETETLPIGLLGWCDLTAGPGAMGVGRCCVIRDPANAVHALWTPGDEVRI